ncbi:MULTISPECIES: L,D-transpeptidase [unclassified Paracoccus (in: a-proteobacteria)]|uniref:L,D-transpeptidase n=1 Tax=unclassified Paracoccus (in: a-proteobacteria) TaxID=2688777 RepID=UPI0012B2F1F2|nr:MULTISPECIES: L,D-transpeptidase [unclassified Paracoccus (in: a-proteobacteria)]UXU75961.1 L,D-transpeptidase [Paracoccus sp. SMMA_5]UXU81870.1 L,D-transpeptidase [Paracoccus sp. SMMA_5_TC]
MITPKKPVSRRKFLTASVAMGAAAGLAAPALAQAIDPYTGQPLQNTGAGGATPDAGMVQYDQSQDSRRNISSFRMQDWQPYFSNLTNGAILVDLTSRALHFWSEDQSVYKLFPTSVPVSPDLTRTGRTEIIKKVEGPSWAPTPEMKKRNPEWPDFVPPGPDNPLGTHALWLSWQYYRIHGTHDTRKIGRKSSNGCIGLYNEHIKQLYDLTKIGTQVLLI